MYDNAVAARHLNEILHMEKEARQMTLKKCIDIVENAFFTGYVVGGRDQLIDEMREACK